MDQIGWANKENNANEMVDSPNLDSDQWDEEAIDLLTAVDEGPHYRKKRHTLLRLAEAAYLNYSQADVFRMPSCASKVAHYKWREVDPAYEAAYLYLIGDPAIPGLARLRRENELDEAEQLAIGALAQARATLRLASAEAANTLQAALNAATQHGPKWHERIAAANSILDRADRDTAANRQAPALAIVDNAIMSVYGRDDDHDDDVNRQAGLQDSTDEPQPTPEAQDENPSDEHDISMDAHPDPPAADKDIGAARSALNSFISKVRDDDDDEQVSDASS